MEHSPSTYRMMVTVLTLILLAAGTPLTQGTLASSSDQTVEFTVSTDRFVFVDETERASFHADGACLDSLGLLDVTGQSCDGEQIFSSGTLGMARLGMDAHRRIDAGEEQRPLVETRTGQADEQTITVRLDVHEPGDVLVQIAAYPSEQVDPKLVANSSSAGGEESQRSVTWELADAESGAYAFSARFSPNAESTFAGGFVPEVTIERTDTSTTLLAHPGDRLLADGVADRTSTLVMEQRVTPAVSSPHVEVGSYTPAGDSPTPMTFFTSATLDAYGAYHGPSMGEVIDEETLWLEELDESAVGNVSSAVRGSPTPSRPTVQKARIDFATERTDDWTTLGFTREMATATPGDGWSTSRTAGPLGGLLFDGDSVTHGFRMALGATSDAHTDEPQGTDGVRVEGALTTDWQGEVALTWSGIWASSAPAAEPNEVHRVDQEAREALGLSPVRYPLAYGASAAVPMIVEGGDIDNREGQSPVYGEPITVPLPDAWETGGGSMITIGARDAPTEYAWNFTTTDEGALIEPRIEPGGYWLESSIDGYDREWSPHVHMVTAGARDYAPQGSGLGPFVEETLTMAPGKQANVQIFDGEGQTLAEEDISEPGTWGITFDGEQLSLRPASQP